MNKHINFPQVIENHFNNHTTVTFLAKITFAVACIVNLFAVIWIFKTLTYFNVNISLLEFLEKSTPQDFLIIVSFWLFASSTINNLIYSGRKKWHKKRREAYLLFEKQNKNETNEELLKKINTLFEL